MKHFITAAVCGFGSRGKDAYASYQHLAPDKLKLVAIADPDPEKRDAAVSEYGVAPANCYQNGEKLLQQPRLADVLIIATQDRDHIRYALPALEKGYHLLLEKPISPSLEECLALRKKAHECGRIVIVCHVLRYAQFYQTIHELLQKNILGPLHTLEATENIAYWHYAHSYVRGNWRRSEDSSPLILAKSCHDMDIIRWLVGSPCVSLSSYGGLSWFKPENAPDPEAKRCLSGCRCKEECPYDCEKIYLFNKKSGYYDNNTGWPCNVLTNHPTRETLYEALRNGPYGRCVYQCDNNVADHQTVNMLFENGVSASFVLSAFTEGCYRTVRITGSFGELEGNLEENTIHVRIFGKPEQLISLDPISDRFAGHGGGDARMMEYLCNLLLSEDQDALTSIDASVESHVMAMAAEYSRLHGGESVSLTDFTAENMAQQNI